MTLHPRSAGRKSNLGCVRKRLVSIGIMSAAEADFDSLEQDLSRMKRKFRKCRGRYKGAVQDAVFIKDIPLDELLELGEKYHQESVIFGAGSRAVLLYTSGLYRGAAVQSRDISIHYTSEDPPGPFLRITPNWCVVIDFSKAPNLQT